MKRQSRRHWWKDAHPRAGKSRETILEKEASTTSVHGKRPEKIKKSPIIHLENTQDIPVARVLVYTYLSVTPPRSSRISFFSGSMAGLDLINGSIFMSSFAFRTGGIWSLLVMPFVVRC